MSGLRFSLTPVVLLAVLGALALAPAVRAETEGTGWEAFTLARPTYLHPGESAKIEVWLLNIGARPSSGSITMSDTLPEGVTVTSVSSANWSCGGLGTESVTCKRSATAPPVPSGAGEEFDEGATVGLLVQVSEGAAEGRQLSRVSAAGGGAQGTTVASDPLTISAGEPGFGFAAWDVWFSNANGSIDLRAGSHPYEATFAISYNELVDGRPAGGEMRDVEVELPPGFFGEPNSTPRCTRPELDANACPAETQIGYNIALAGTGAGVSRPAAIYNMVPPEGVADEFGIVLYGKDVFFDTGPRGYGQYRLVTHADNIPVDNIVGDILTLWGVAPEPSHNAARVTGPNAPEGAECKAEGCRSGAPARPFLTLPTACAGAQPFAIRGAAWEGAVAEEMIASSHNAQDVEAGFTGCSNLSFNPSLSTVPDTSEADTPSGLGVEVTFPQEALRVPETPVESTDENTTVTLPEGLVINPGQAAGLLACTEAQADLGEEGAPTCPDASKVGTVKVKTPLLEGAFEMELTGDVYVLAQYQGQPGETPRLTLASHPPTLQLLIVLSGDGIDLKLVANVQLNEATGQLTTTLTETPGLPFTSFELEFSGGAQAALATPAACGIYTTTSDFTPWASPFAADAFPSSTLQIASGPEGTACPSRPLPFSPELIAGSTTDEAGGFTNFSLLLRRGDGQQRIERLQFKAPPGLTGTISSVAQCPEPQASKGECPEASKIGSATVASGPGPYPLVIPQPGDPESPIYLTGPYDGAPFGLSIVTHVIAGPFNLGTIVTRAKIEIDPVTAQITVTTEPLPQIVDGVPTDLRLIDSVIDRPHFMINPTNCEQSSFSGTAWGAAPPGLSEPHDEASLSSRFQVGSCRSLQFKPTFKVSTSAHTSRTRGARMTFHVSLPDQAGLGEEANVRKVKVSLPKKLPTPLKTLQKACTEQVFAANPASCPAASDVAMARVSTPLLPGELTGPAYFVSHGGAKYPELIIVLSGDGVTEQVHGETFISKSGITTGTFSAIPDVPFTNFELTFPQSQYPAFVANGNLCKGTLKMPTELVGQNGSVITDTTKISVGGCPKKKPKHGRRAKHSAKRGRKKR